MTEHIRCSGRNGWGATHWYVELKNSTDGVPGDFTAAMRVMAQFDGLHLGGQVISWADLDAAKAYALDHRPTPPLLQPVMGARVDGNKVVLSVRGGNKAARLLCSEIVAGLPKKG